MDTTQDIRIRLADRVLSALEQQARGGLFGSLKRHPQVMEQIHEMSSALMTLRYSYLEASDLPEHAELQRLHRTAGAVLDLLESLGESQPGRRAHLRFFRRTLDQLPASFTLPASLESAVAVEVGNVATTTRHPKARSLLLCHVEVFGNRLEIVTNLLETRPGHHMKVALVYPAEVMGILSEAQFVGAASPGSQPGTRPELTEGERQEVRRSMGQFLEGGA